MLIQKANNSVISVFRKRKSILLLMPFTRFNSYLIISDYI